MLNPCRQGGFSIVELFIALTIAGILLALGAPSLSGYIQNARLGSTAKSFYNGLALARSEAIRLNQPVEFALTNTAIASGVENSMSPDAAGRNWVVRYRFPVSSASYQLIEAKSALEGGGSSIVVAASSPSVTFTGLGQTTIGSESGIAVSNPALGACAPVGPVRCWNVIASPGGRVRLCDPAAPIGDSRAC